MDKIFGEIVSMSVDSAWLIIAVIIVRALLQKSPMYFRKILWGLVGLRLIIPFSFESSLSLVPDKVSQTADIVSKQVVAADIEQSLSFTEIVPVLWLVVFVAFLIYGSLSYIKLKIKIFDGTLVRKNIYQSEKIKSPFVCGFVKPKIYVPYGLDEATLNCVLQHEETHIKYADHIIKALSFIILCIHWFNPLVWVSYFLFCKDIELACDESVVKKYSADECREYAKSLLDLGVSKVRFSACPIAFGEVSIKTRIKSVVNYKKASKALVMVSLCICIGVSLCFMTEPEAPFKESVENVDITEETTRPVTEETTKLKDEPTIELVTEPTTEPVTEPATETITEQANQSAMDSVIEADDGETTQALLRLEKPSFFMNPYDTTHYVRPDPMRDKVYEAGVFANEEEKDALINNIENEIVQLDVGTVSE